MIDPSSGSWATCEMHEWYGTETMPADVACPGNCSCSRDESLSYTHATDDTLGIDLVADSAFPCDLFQFYFGVPRSSYEIVKGYSKVISDCSTLGPDSFGIYWVTGSECRDQLQYPGGFTRAPVMLIPCRSTDHAEWRRRDLWHGFRDRRGKCERGVAVQWHQHGIRFCYRRRDLGSYTGTFQVVWNENIANKSGASGGLGAVLGGWSDFHRDWE